MNRKLSHLQMLPYIVTQVMSLILFVVCNALVNLKLLTKECARILSIKSNQIVKYLTLDKLVLNTTNKSWPKIITQISECRFVEIHRIVLQTYTLGTQSRTVLSLDAEAIKCPDGENFTDSTAS